MMRIALQGVFAAGVFAFVGCTSERTSAPSETPATGLVVQISDGSVTGLPLGLDEYLAKIPGDNPLTEAKVNLGKHLYFDTRLSKDGTVSCATCHDPLKGWSDGRKNSKGIAAQVGDRNAPTVINRVFSEAQFWDGRAASLEEQALGPIQNPIEMGHTLEGMLSGLRLVSGYKPLFSAAFGDEEITGERVGQAIASFERTIVSGNSPFDRYEAGDKTANQGTGFGVGVAVRQHALSSFFIVRFTLCTIFDMCIAVAADGQREMFIAPFKAAANAAEFRGGNGFTAGIADGNHCSFVKL